MNWLSIMKLSLLNVKKEAIIIMIHTVITDFRINDSKKIFTYFILTHFPSN